MKIIPMKLPPLPGKTTLQLKGVGKSIPIKTRERKLSIQHLQTTDETSDNNNRFLNDSSLTRPTSKKSLDSCKSIKLKDNNRAFRSIKKAKTYEHVDYSDLPPHVTSKSWIIYQIHHNKYIYGKRTHKQRQIASLTKILNLITILQITQKFDLNPKKITIKATKIASSLQGTTAELKHQGQYLLWDLLFGMMLPSGNDAAFLVAEVGGYLLHHGVPSDWDNLSRAIQHRKGGFCYYYLSQMNVFAHKIGMVNSNFANPHGLSNPQNYSTAEDVAKLCGYAMKHKKFRHIVQTQKHEYALTYLQKKVDFDEEGSQLEGQIVHKERKIWQNTNKMLGEGWSGIKTGITPNAGPCLAASLYRTFSGKQYEFVVVLLDSESMEARWEQVHKLVEWTIINRQYL